MKLKSIFANTTTQQVLYSIIIKGNKSEYEKAFENLFSAQYVRSYLKDNLEYIKSSDVYKGENLEQALIGIRNERDEILKRLNADVLKIPNCLEELFQPLTNTDYRERPLKPSKLKLESKHDRTFKNSKIRIYAIRVTKNMFVVTGAAIKLVKEMKDHPDTNAEEIKINQVRNWMKNNNIETEDDLTYYYEQ